MCIYLYIYLSIYLSIYLYIYTGSVEGVGPVSVTTDDYKTLKVETYLNDTIIDFYLRYLQFAIMDKNDRDR